MDFHWPECVTELRTGWTLVATGAGDCATPADIPSSTEALPATVPGTVAGSLFDADLFDSARPVPLDHRDYWYRCKLDEAPGPALLRFEGLATICEIWLNGERLLTSESMFEPCELAVTLQGGDELALAFRALRPHLAKKGPRARWRPQMMSEQGLRLVRTTLLGHMPGWCPDIHAIGPWRPVSLIRPTACLSGLTLSASLDESSDGLLTVSFAGPVPEGATLACGGRTQAFQTSQSGGASASLHLPGIEPWWPATHGHPTLHDVTISATGRTALLTRTGFRRVELDRGEDGRDFALRINGKPIFCRGAVWTSPDILRLSGDTEAYAPWLALAAEAGMNMIRIGGTMAYESPAFFALCDRLGIMVWQDLMFANFDYPVKDEAFVAHVRAEVSAFLEGTMASPALTVLCGGSEMHQQGAMLGLPETVWNTPLTREVLPLIAAEKRPDVPFVENSPSGGAQPFFVQEGVGHYYGVGAYCRPLEDARRANVRFASECLAFAHVPQQATLDAHLPVAAVHHPDWKARVPRDRSASWDFEDIRDHYLSVLYDADPARLRREDPARYLDLSRAVTGEVLTETFSEWRRKGSSCNGALVWTFQDLLPGPGWGLVDATGEPKPVWYAFRRASRPVQVFFTDEGVNGLAAHVINESPNQLTAVLSISALRDGERSVVSGSREIVLPAGECREVAVTDLFGAFFDTNYAYRFGPPSHDVVVASLKIDGTEQADAFFFPLGRSKAMRPGTLAVSLQKTEEGWSLALATDVFQQSVHLDIPGFRPADDWFHLAPGQTRKIDLIPRKGTDRESLPEGTVSTHSGSRTSF